jgi:hypothetical protein
MQSLQSAQIDPLRRVRKESAEKTLPAQNQSASAPAEAQAKTGRQKTPDESSLH